MSQCYYNSQDKSYQNEQERIASDQVIQAALWHHQKGQPQAALKMCRKILTSDPLQPVALQLLGVIQLQTGQADLARDTLQLLLENHPDATGALLPFGSACLATGDEQCAETAFRQLVTIMPELAEGHFALGQLLISANQRQEGTIHLDRAVFLRPNWPEAVNELGVVYMRDSKTETNLHRARELFRKASALAADWPVPVHNLGESFQVTDDIHAAINTYEQVLARWPDFQPSRCNLAYCLLKSGRFKEGWAAHEWRFASRGQTPAREGWDMDVWDGTPFEGRTLIVWTEQGLGDHLQFVRYLPMVAARGGKVWLQSPAPLASLMATCKGVDRVILGDPPRAEIDLQIPLMTLPKILGTRLETIPNETSYLQPPVTLPKPIGACLQTGVGPRVGLIWKSGTLAPFHANRDLDVASVKRLLSVPEVRWYPLQFGEAIADFVGAEAASCVSSDLGPDLGDFGETAAIVAELDLIITVDTSALHLVGALGKPVWAVIPKPSDWRWFLSGDHSPWYPSLRLFRQEHAGDWFTPVSRIIRDLESLTQSGVRHHGLPN